MGASFETTNDSSARFCASIHAAIVLNVDMGNFALALALGLVLLAISLSINVLFQYFQGGTEE